MKIDRCPFCRGDDCEHFLGWTEDGKTIQHRSTPQKMDISETDRIVTTGVTARVYRQANEREEYRKLKAKFEGK
jgi:Zn-finger nucleic acid-binding protein